MKRLISLVAVILVSINFTTTLIGSNYDVVADTIETLTSDESQDQEDPDTSETVPETEESDETDVTESSLSEETAETTFATDPSEIVPTPVPAPSPEDIAEALYPSVLTEFETTAPDGTVLSISGVFPQTSYAEAELFENDSVGRVIKGYDADLIIPEGCTLTEDPVTVSFPFDCDEQFAVVAFADGTTPVVNDAYEYQDGVITITADVDALEESTSSAPGQGTHKWIGLGIGTGLSSVTLAKYNGTSLTADDATEATSVGLDQAGEFVLYIRAEEVVQTPKTITLKADGYGEISISIVVVAPETN